MKKPRYNVTATCESPRCDAGQFTVRRTKVHVDSTEGRRYPIEHIVCPECRMWARITDVKEVA